MSPATQVELHRPFCIICHATGLDLSWPFAVAASHLLRDGREIEKPPSYQCWTVKQDHRHGRVHSCSAECPVIVDRALLPRLREPFSSVNASMIKLISVLLLAAGGAATFAPINTTSGQYIGHTAPITNDVIEYLGIRYAQPAVGELRFSSPTPYTSSETVEATAFSPDCPFTPANPVAYPNKTAHFDVIFQNFTSQNRNPQSEDCLALNIWSKNSGHVNKPVLLWIHGGSKLYYS